MRNTVVATVLVAVVAVGAFGWVWLVWGEHDPLAYL